MENLRQVLYNFHRCNNNSTQFNQEMEKTTNTTECQGENTFYENTFFFKYLKIIVHNLFLANKVVA